MSQCARMKAFARSNVNRCVFEGKLIANGATKWQVYLKGNVGAVDLLSFRQVFAANFHRGLLSTTDK